MRDKDIAEIDAHRQGDFHLNTPPPPTKNVATLLCTEKELQASKLVAKKYEKNCYLTNQPICVEKQKREGARKKQNKKKQHKNLHGLAH